MALEVSLGQFARKMAKAVKNGQVGALRKALRKARQKMISDYGKDTSLASKAIRKRVKIIPPKKGVGLGSINVAIAFGVPLGEFKPIVKMVKGAKRLYEGVTVRMGTLGRAIVPKAWLWTARSGKQIVLQRDKDSRYPISTPKSDLLKESAKRRQEEHKAYLAQAFKDEYDLFSKDVER